jgi:hypothetical protein
MSENSTPVVEAPVVEQTATPTVEQTVESNVAAEQVEQSVEAPVAEVEVEETTTEAPPASDYSWVPAKFMKNGLPDVALMAKSYTNLEKLAKGKGIANVPDSIDAYEYTPQGFDVDPEILGNLKIQAIEKGITTDQYQWMMQQYEAEMGRFLPSPEKTHAYLTEAWGDRFDVMSENAKRAFNAYVPSDIPMEAVGNNPYLIDILSRIGADMAEDSTPSAGGSSSPRGRMSEEEKNAMMKDPEYGSGSPKGKELFSAVEDWYKRNSK